MRLGSMKVTESVSDGGSIPPRSTKAHLSINSRWAESEGSNPGRGWLTPDPGHHKMCFVGPAWFRRGVIGNWRTRQGESRGESRSSKTINANDSVYEDVRLAA